MMRSCPMEDMREPCDLDPTYVWFANGKFADVHCRTTAFGSPCQFYCSGLCEMVHTCVKHLRFCPLPRYDMRNGKTLIPKTNYEIDRRLL